jgi:choline dehydrogenase-like flavoprotein
VRAGRSVVVLERGGLRAHAGQLRHGAHEVAWPTAAHSHEDAAGSPSYPWNYVFGVGGGSLHRTGAAPRLLPSDFTVRSDHRVGRDWPIGYDDLQPFYVEAEQLLRVAGDDLPLFPRSGPLPQPAHALSPVDELAAEVLEPFGALPQARPSVAVGGRPACCGNTNCALCPVDARASMLHLLDDERLLEHPRLELRAGVAVERLQVERDRVTALDCVDRRRRRSTVEASRVVLAAGGLENPAVLLRSGLDGEHVGRWPFDHGHRLVHLQLDRTAGSGRGATHVTGASWAYADGPWPDRSGSQLVLPFNQGLLGTGLVRDAIVAGDGRSRPLRERVERTLVFDVLGEELPLPERRMELPRRRDRLGLPRTRIHYPGDSAYLQTARSRLAADLERRFGRYGARVVAVERAGEGSHQLGTCFMGERDGVVDADLRHHRYENVFVAGGSAFPFYSAHHPTLTICAPALRLGRHLVSSS